MRSVSLSMHGAACSLVTGVHHGARSPGVISPLLPALPPCRPDIKNGLYQDSIKKGDLLLNRVQKLSRIIDVE
jgi:hypothetical protein